jgi:hypothetical protein
MKRIIKQRRKRPDQARHAEWAFDAKVGEACALDVGARMIVSMRPLREYLREQRKQRRREVKRAKTAWK